MGDALLALTLGIAGYVWWRIGTARRHEAWEDGLRAGYRRRIAEDPANIGAWEALAESLYRAGRLDEARDAYLGALEAGSDALVHDRTRYKLLQVDGDIRERAQARGRKSAPPPREAQFCPHCGASNPPQRRHCDLCHALLPLPTFRAALHSKEVQRASLEGVCLIAVVGVLLSVIPSLPLDVEGVLVIATVMVVAWRLLQSIEGRRG